MESTSFSALTIYRRLLEIARPYRLHLGGMLVISLAATPLALLTPLPLKIVVDSVVGTRALPAWLAYLLPARTAGSQTGALAVALALLLGIALLNQLQGLANSALQAYAGGQLLLRFRAQLFAHVQRLSFAYHDARGSADATYRIQYDSQAIQSLAISGLLPFITSSVTLIAMLIVTARLNGRLALLAVGLVLPLYVLVRTSRGTLHRQWTQVKESESSAMSVIHEVLGSLRVVKAFGQEEREQQRFVNHSSLMTWGHLKLAGTQGAFDVLVGLIVASGMATALYLGALDVRSGKLTVGELLVVMTYMTHLLTPIETITRRFAQIQGSLASAARALALLDERPDVAEIPDARPLGRSTGAVRFQQVSFGYQPDRPVLHDISFEVVPGMRVGISGRTGAGKTTLVNLLTRFYDPTGGQILLDGVPLSDYRLSDVRNQFAIVLQEPVLFSTSIGENIAYARPGASFDEIVAASRAASAHEFISELPGGYETLVGERGLRLSGGERQRISIARAFLKDAPILILDEPTSSVDIGTETAIMAAMERLMHGRTTFMIAHRLSTLEICDMKLVLADGHLVEYRLEPATQPAFGWRSLMSTEHLRVIVSGLIAQHPSLGGVAWDYVQYAAGLHRLGHDVYYFEDSGEWPYTLDGGPSGNDWIAYDPSPNVTHLANVMERFGLKDRWAYRFPIKPRWFGMSHARRREVLRTADLLINVSGSLERPGHYRSVRRLAYIDSDPVFTQIKLALPLGHLKFQGRVSAHDVHFSFGERLSTAVPTTYDWQPTRQPILMSEWSPSGEPTPAYTTVMSWASYRPIGYRGQRYGQKDVEFRRFIGLPAQVPAAKFDVALNSTEHIAWQTDADSAQPTMEDPPPSARRVTAAEFLTSAGWNVIDARVECSDLHRYRRFIQRSKAEWSIAKNGYVKGRAGWFSCRSACYLAAGRPVVVQDTGFSEVIPTGIGVLTFNTLDEAAAAVKEVEADYHRHARAAREIAAAYFDSDRVLSDFVEQAMTSAPRSELQRVGA